MNLEGESIHTIPPLGDNSTDLTDDEIDGAVTSEGSNQLAQLLLRALSPREASVGEGSARYSITRHELRRRDSHLYLRTHLGCPGKPTKVLMHRVDWLQQPSALERI